MSLASDFFGTQFAICLVFFYHVRILSPDRTKRKLPGKKRKERIWCAHAREAKKKLLCEAIFVVEFARSEAL